MNNSVAIRLKNPDAIVDKQAGISGFAMFINQFTFLKYERSLRFFLPAYFLVVWCAVSHIASNQRRVYCKENSFSCTPDAAIKLMKLILNISLASKSSAQPGI